MNLKKYLDPEHMPYCFENPVYNYETLKERAVEAHGKVKRST